jgi:hypothetical protein
MVLKTNPWPWLHQSSLQILSRLPDTLQIKHQQFHKNMSSTFVTAPAWRLSPYSFSSGMICRSVSTQLCQSGLRSRLSWSSTVIGRGLSESGLLVGRLVSTLISWDLLPSGRWLVSLIGLSVSIWTVIGQLDRPRAGKQHLIKGAFWKIKTRKGSRTVHLCPNFLILSSDPGL